MDSNSSFFKFLSLPPYSPETLFCEPEQPLCNSRAACYPALSQMNQFQGHLMVNRPVEMQEQRFYCLGPGFGFLKSCFACKKMLSCDKDIYMYRDLCAFCSTDCRDRQIMLDEQAERTEMGSTTVDSSNSMQCYADVKHMNVRVAA
ncbi:hypothetical protein AMTRI_Chr03g148660 [Amborella trichopoda]